MKHRSKDAKRYQWLRKEMAAGRETYLGEYMMQPKDLDKYIDEKMRGIKAVSISKEEIIKILNETFDNAYEDMKK